MRLELLEAVGQIQFDLLHRVTPPGVVIDRLLGHQVALELHDLGPVLVHRGRSLRNLLVQPFDLNFFLGNDVHVLANVGHQVFDHPPEFNFEFHGHTLRDRIFHPAERSANITGRIPAEKQHRQQAKTATATNVFLIMASPSHTMGLKGKSTDSGQPAPPVPSKYSGPLTKSWTAHTGNVLFFSRIILAGGTGCWRRHKRDPHEGFALAGLVPLN